MRVKQRLVAFSLTCLSACAHVTPAAAPSSAALAPELSSLGFYVGHWACTGHELDERGNVTKDYPDLEVRVAPAYDRWLTVDVYDHGAHVSSELKGVDGANHFHHVWTANDGSYGSLTATGWTGSHMVFDEDHPAATDKTRMTFTKLDATHYTHRAETDTGHGYRLGFEKRCHKLA